MLGGAFQMSLSSVIGIYPLAVKHELLTGSECIRSIAELECIPCVCACVHFGGGGGVLTDNLLRSGTLSCILGSWAQVKKSLKTDRLTLTGCVISAHAR